MYRLERESNHAQVYRPFLENPWPTTTIGVRSAVDPTSLTAAVRQQVLALDRDLPVFNVRTMEQAMANSVASNRLNTLLLGIFAAVAFILAAVGIYGVMSYSVAQRAHEIGIRMALGARSLDVLKLVVGQGMALILIGTAWGLAGAFALTRFMKTLLFGVSATDPWTFAAVALSLSGVALLACYLPARRATKVDPLATLRHD
jgi:putative ABC transport system permease protein